MSEMDSKLFRLITKLKNRMDLEIVIKKKAFRKKVRSWQNTLSG